MSRKLKQLLPSAYSLVLAAAALVALACNNDEVTGVARPWKGKCDVDASFTSPTTLSITGTCQLAPAHLGSTTVSAIQTIEPGPTGIAYTNTATYTAANGDQLNTTNVGFATPTASGLSLLGTETAVGGTGRFENASGTAALTGAVAFTSATTTTGSYSLDGTLNY